MPKKVARTRCDNTMTEGAFRSFIKSGLREKSMRWKPKYTCKMEARHYEKLPNANGRMVFHSKCAICSNLYPETTCAVDHKEPVIPLEGFVSWDSVVERMFVEKEDLQVLCTTCHNIKTQEEKEERKLHGKR